MKKISILLSFIAVLFISCEGEPGPPGFDGFDGIDGVDGANGADGHIGNIFEAEITFNADNDYQDLVDFPTSIDVFPSDIVIAYVLSEVNDGTDIWEPLPQTLFLENDILLYSFDYTDANIRFFMDGTVDFDALAALYTDGIIFRVAIIPANVATKINTLDFNEVMGALKVKTVEKVQ